MTTTDAPVAAPADLALMEPVLRRGRSFLDRAMMPGDENELRLNALLAAAAERGLDGVVIFGAAHLPENLGYYANYTPTTFHGALVARTGEQPVLFAGKGGARDHPYIRTVSWVGDLRYAAAIGPAVVEVADSWSSPWKRLGVAGLDTTLPHHVRDDIVAALGDRYEPVDDIVSAHRRAKSAREIAVLTTAHDIAQRAAEAAVDAYDRGAGRRTALAAADFTARAGDAHDCRITARTETGGTASLSEVRDDRGPLAAVVAVEYLGYWGMAAIRLGRATAPADAPIDAVVARMRPGVTLSDALGADAGDFLVNGIGCAPAEAPPAGPGQATAPIAGADQAAPSAGAGQADAALRRHDVLAIVHLGSAPDGPDVGVRTVVIDEAGARSLR
ncbi:hypothetical protein [Rugosimonospora africana]|uniref:Uncharacterized protein n=1 Tax=Rugosimonospora africana TaxID=556532 RepID=A0A8J3R1Q1_9ACTN|nr:hypothetical protein [Rugosimonospora africana]GIH19760.1 hypothetical protein Raf01_79320 [Rugosimonospora africana]